MVILDTNVLSETLRPRPAEAVRAWLALQPTSEVFTTAVTEAEMRYGVAIMPAGRRREGLQSALDSIFGELLEERVLPFDADAAKAYAAIASLRRRAGNPINQLDGQIAAIARARAAVVATRNVDDFSGCGVVLVNPWDG